MGCNIALETLAGMIDNTNLKVDIQKEDLKKLCEESVKYGFKSVAVNHSSIKYCRQLLAGTGVGIVTGISYPLGTNTLEEKLFETKHTIEIGATEIDYVINISELRAKNYDYMRKEMEEIVKICRQNNVLCKVILETYYLTDDEIKQMCKIAAEVRPDFIKTSTGQIKGGGARVEHVRLIKEALGDSGVQVKAAGEIRTLDDALKMIEAGATRLGTSSGAKIVEEYMRRFG
ncbi:deoxyribose-phosphate aldolase [Thermoanaerobacterium sp. DL9XJH110]|uniref:deoxyribose-phosphate aldolase n=1 Tax=Thermoanaerobacterium sp. DL9XJH110 TaxID=3386643 RepID=UPI003BB494E0